MHSRSRQRLTVIHMIQRPLEAEDGAAGRETYNLALAIAQRPREL